MENTDIIEKELQVTLFSMIQKTLPGHQTLVNVISDLLGISTSATYSRIRGSKPLRMGETIKLCRQFGISLNSLAGIADRGQIQCYYSPLDVSSPDQYFTMIASLNTLLDRHIALPDAQIHILAATIPAFYVMLHPQLAHFRYFSWSSTFGSTSCYEEFVGQMPIEQLHAGYTQIVQKYLQFPSVEIWTPNTIDVILSFLSYHHTMGHFADPNTATTLCTRLTEMIDTVEQWAADGTKGNNATPYRLYISDIDIGNTFVLFKSHHRLHCWIKLFTVHGMDVLNEEFCGEVERWMNQSLQRATIISGSSARERRIFFDRLRQKITDCVQTLQTVVPTTRPVPFMRLV